MKPTIAAILALLLIATPARAAYVWYQTDTIDLTYPNNTTLTGELNIQDGAPSVVGYILEGSSSLSVNGTLLGRTITNGTGYLYDLNPLGGVAEISFYVPPPNAPNAPTPYGETPLYLSVPNIFLNGQAPISGTVNLTDFCSVGTNGTSCSNLSAVPLPATLPLFGSALAGLGGFGWLRRRKDSRNRKA